ncbi:hypothetical protein V2J09_011288 [Rumex salicifolius]
MSFDVPSSLGNIEDALLRLKLSFHNKTILSSWDPSQPPCLGNLSNWVGVICSRGGNVYALRLENMGLSGEIDINALIALPKLRSVSFMGNEFEGPMPSIWRLRALRSIYLSKNRFEGAISPNAFDGLNRLEILHLANNNFIGEIPPSLAKLPRLVELRLEDNKFQGSIPYFQTIFLRDLSLANNQLDGPIPNALSGIPADAFIGNKGLCGMPLESCFPSTDPSSSPLPPPKKKLVSIIPIIIAASIVLLVALVAIALIARKRKGKRGNRPLHVQGISLQPNRVMRNLESGQYSNKKKSNPTTKSKSETGKLCFMRYDGERFELPELLQSSAELLGSGCFGASYKASLGNCMMVVKRFKQMNNLDKEDFQEHMRRLGRLQHHNLLSLVAYCYRKDEKLLVSEGQLTLDWATRLKVIKGVARGLSYLYKELPSLTSPHGHLKSSNVLLDESFNPSLNDYGLTPLMNQDNAHQLMVAYKSPEYVEKGRINKKTDIWSLGILIVEIITGALPTDHYLQHGSRQVDLTRWVEEVVGEGVGVHVFDKNMGLTQDCENEILKMLRIGLSCCQNDVLRRWDIKEACERIEEVMEMDSHLKDDFHSSYVSEGIRGCSSREKSEDFTIV